MSMKSLFVTIALSGAAAAGSASAAHAQEAPFSIALLPDTQHYTESNFSFNQYRIYQHQADWIVRNNANSSKVPIKFVVSLGDMTDHNIATEWDVAKEAHTILDGAKIPYSVVTGNHDILNAGGVYERRSLLSNYFSTDFFLAKQNSGYGGSFDRENQNNYFYFNAGATGSMKFMVLSVEYAARKDVVAWANKVIAANTDRRVILVTHSYLNQKAERVGEVDPTEGSANGANMEGREAVDLWNELASRHSNIFMILSGHIQGRAYRTRTGLNGNVVHEILSDFQSEPLGGTGGEKFGNGWFRVLTFTPGAAGTTGTGKIQVTTVNSEATGAGNTCPLPANPNTFDCRDIFPSGSSSFFLTYNHATGTSTSKHNNLDYPIVYDSQKPVSYAYNAGSPLFRDRMAHQALTGHHSKSKIAAAPNGNFVVVWEDDSDGNGVTQIHARGFDKDGAPRFSELTVNAVSRGFQRNPNVAMDDLGNFVVVYEDDSNTNNFYEIRAHGYNANGTEKFTDRLVNAVSTGQQRNPAVAMDATGNFVVAFEDDQDQNNYYEILARGFTAAGAPDRIAQFTVNRPSAGQQFNPAIGMDASGKFVVVYEDDSDDDGTMQIRARGMTATGGNRITEFFVNNGSTAGSHTEGDHLAPAIALDQDGDFVVVWEDDSDQNAFNNIRARGFNSAGGQRFAQFNVNSNLSGQQYRPAIAMNNVGNFAVVWEDDADSNNTYNLTARTFTANGVQRTADFAYNSDSSGQQYSPAAAFDEQGRYLVSWDDDMDGNGNFLILTRNKTF